MLWLMLACYTQDFPMEEGQLRVIGDTLHVGHWDRLPAPGLVAADSEFCVDVQCVDCDEDLVDVCWGSQGSGALEVEGDCFWIGEGPGRWDFPVTDSCPQPGLISDGFTIEGVASDILVQLEFPMRDLAPDLNAEGSGIVPADRDVFPEDLAPDTLRLVGSTRLDVVLRWFGRPVGFDTRELTDLRVERTDAVDFAVEDATRLWLAPSQPTSGEVRVTWRGVDVSLGEFEVVDVAEAASLDVIVGVDAETGAPLGVLADVRDADGNVLLGVPIEWETTREMLVSPDAPGDGVFLDATEEQVAFFTECMAPEHRGGDRRLNVSATVGELQDDVQILWQGEVEDDPNWVQPPECEELVSDCGCGSRGASGWAALAGLVVLLWRR